MILVRNLASGEELLYSCSPRQACIAAYAQCERRDFNTWDYEERYGHLVEEASLTLIVGNWAAFKEQVDS
jgi:hypothetical protein